MCSIVGFSRTTVSHENILPISIFPHLFVEANKTPLHDLINKKNVSVCDTKDNNLKIFYKIFLNLECVSFWISLSYCMRITKSFCSVLQFTKILNSNYLKSFQQNQKFRFILFTLKWALLNNNKVEKLFVLYVHIYLAPWCPRSIFFPETYHLSRNKNKLLYDVSNNIKSTCIRDTFYSHANLYGYNYTYIFKDGIIYTWRWSYNCVYTIF